MNKFIFKSPRRLVKNSSNISLEDRMREIEYKLQFVQSELRAQRQDHVDIKLMLNKLLIEKHLQMQVDDYYDKEDASSTDSL